MRLKPLPSPPQDLGTVGAAQSALPLVPDSEADCCRRIGDRLGIEDREEARAWLTLLRALDLAAESDRGYHRTRRDPGREELARDFQENVYGAQEVLAALGDDPRPVESVFGDVEAIVPAWERDRHPGSWRATWRDRTADLFGWFVLLGLAEQVDEGFVRGDLVLAENSEER